MKKIWNREPALFIGLVSSVVSLGTSFGLGLTGEQVGAIMALTSAILSFVVRSKVTPV